MNVQGISWMGVRSKQYDALRHLLRDVMGINVSHDAGDVTWFSLPGGEEIQIYDESDTDHTFFGTAPVIGFLVDDFDLAKAEMEAAGVAFIGSGDATRERRWQHFRGPDGNVYEIMGPSAVTP